MNLREAMEFVFTHRDSWREGAGAKTARINAEHVIRILGPTLDVDIIRSAHFAALTRQLQAEDKSGSTINRITSALKTMLTELRQNGLEAPLVEFKRQKEGKPRQTYFTEEEAAVLVEAAANLRDHLLLHDSILFSIKTGCRQGELLELKVDDIDFDKQTICFRDVKTGGDHWLKMSDDLVPILQRRIEYRISDDLFPWRDKDCLLRSFKSLVNSTDVPLNGRVWHSLRHSVATWLCEKSVPIRTVMGVLNHRNVNTTLRYAKASDRAVAAAIDLL